MAEDCNFEVPENADRDELIETVYEQHAMMHAVADDVFLLREQLYGMGMAFESIAQEMQGIRWYQRRAPLLRRLSFNAHLLAAVAVGQSGVDPVARAQEQELDDAFEDIVGRINDND